jgi:hypothetical protein
MVTAYLFYYHQQYAATNINKSHLSLELHYPLMGFLCFHKFSGNINIPGIHISASRTKYVKGISANELNGI